MVLRSKCVTKGICQSVQLPSGFKNRRATASLNFRTVCFAPLAKPLGVKQLPYLNFITVPLIFKFSKGKNKFSAPLNKKIALFIFISCSPDKKKSGDASVWDWEGFLLNAYEKKIKDSDLKTCVMCTYSVYQQP